MPAPAAIAAVELPVGEQVQEQVAEDLEQEKAQRKRKVYEAIEQLYEESGVSIFGSPREADNFEEEEDDEDVDYSKDCRDCKSRYILRRLRNGEIPYRSGPNKLYGNIACPFCCKKVRSDFDSLIQHATGVGRGSEKKHQAVTKARHVAFGVFLRKYAKGHLPFYLPRPPRLAKMPRI